MKRWPVVVLVVLALIILISPGIVGRIAEQNLAASIAWTEADSPAVDIRTESYERGWFTSAGRHRVDLHGDQLGEISDAFIAVTGSTELPSLIVETRLDHGLLPVTSLGRDEGSLVPGLASTVSRFLLDSGDGEPVAVPGALYTTVALSGASRSKLLLEKGSVAQGAATLEWASTDVEFAADRDARQRTVDGSITSLQLESDDISAAIEAVTIVADQSVSAYGFNVGDANIALQKISLAGSGEQVTIDQVVIEATSNVENERLSGRSSFRVAEMLGPTGDRLDVDLQLSFADVDALSVGAISEAFKEAQQGGDIQSAFADAFDNAAGDLQTLMAKGAQFNIEKLEVSLPQGVISSAAAINIVATDPNDSFSWPGVLLNMTASMNLRVPVPLFEIAASLNPDAGSLLGMGILKKDGTDYVLDAEYAKGLVNVNGVPMPVPMPGL